MANGIIIFIITSKYNEDPTALRWIIGTIPIICSIAAFSLTYLGKMLYSERLARLSIDESSPNEEEIAVRMKSKSSKI